METKYQEIFEQFTSNEALESIFPRDTNSKLQFKKQIQDLFKKLDGEGIKKGHRNDYRYNVEKNKDLIISILSFGNNLTSKAQENFDKIKFSLLGVLVNKYSEICEAKNITITSTHCKKDGEKHGKDFLKFVNDVFNIEIASDNDNYALDIKDRENLYYFLKSANILKCGHLTSFFKEKDEVISNISPINVPQTIQSRIRSTMCITELEGFEFETLEKLKQAFFKMMDLLLSKYQENLEEDLREIDKEIKNLINGNELLDNYYEMHQTEIAIKWSLKDSNNQGNIIDNNNFLVFINNINIDQKRQGKPVYMWFLERNSIDQVVIERFKNEVDINSFFAWTNDAATSELISIYKSNGNTYIKYKENKKDRVILFSEFVKKNAVFSNRGRPATNFFALIQILIRQNNKNRKIINELVKLKLKDLTEQITILTKHRTIENEQKLEKLLLPFSALVLYKKTNNPNWKIDSNDNLDEYKFIKEFDKLIDGFTIIEQESIKILKKYELLKECELVKQISDDLNLAAKEICDNNFKLDDNTTLDNSINLIDNNYHSIIIEDISSEEDLQIRYYNTQSRLISLAGKELIESQNHLIKKSLFD